MSNVLVGIMGVILFIGLAVASASYYGQQVMDTGVAADASKVINERAQIAAALELYSRNTGSLPTGTGISGTVLSDMVTASYLRSLPSGGASAWVVDVGANALLSPVAGSAAYALKVCIAARAKAGMSAPSTIYKCDASDAPGHVLDINDPCCKS